MVSTTLTTIVSQSSTGTNQHHHYQRQSHSSHPTTTNRNSFYYTNPNSLSSLNGDTRTANSHLPESVVVSTTTNQIFVKNSGTLNTLNTSPNSSRLVTSISDPISITSAPVLKTLKNDINILAQSPPLSEQISKLFPKCRPKNDVNSNSNQSEQINQTNGSLIDDLIPTTTTINNKNNTIITTATETSILTADNLLITNCTTSPLPPPSSTSTLSSESLSSVTPRISTNPFLTNNSLTTIPTTTRHSTHSYNNNSNTNHQDQIDFDYKSLFYQNSAILTSSKDSPPSTSNHNYSEMQRKRNSYHHNNANNHHGTSLSSSNQNPFIKENYNWETRHNTTPASTVLNSPELIENESRNHHHHYLQKQQPIRVGRSPVSHPDTQLSSGSHENHLQQRHHHHRHQQTKQCHQQHQQQYQQQQNQHHQQEYQQHLQQQQHQSQQQRKIIDCNNRTQTPNEQPNVSSSEVIVFDDITENWQNLRVTTEYNSSPPIDIHDEILEINNCDSVTYKDHRSFLDRTFGINVDSRHGIIEYEGSPRRIGQATIDDDNNSYRQSQPSKVQNQISIAATPTPPALFAVTPRPGFPQRVLSPPQESPPTLLSLKQSSLNNTEDTSNDVSEIGTSSDITSSEILMAPTKSSTFDYLYEFSETRKVLEEFFKCPSNEEKPIENGSDVDSVDIQYEFRSNFDGENQTNIYQVEQNLTHSPVLGKNYEMTTPDEEEIDDDEIEEDEEDLDNDDGDDEKVEPSSPPPMDLKQQPHNNYCVMNGGGVVILDNETHHDKNNGYHDIDFFLDSASRSSEADQIDNPDDVNQNRLQSQSYRYSPETTDYDSNCGDLDSLSGEFNGALSAYTTYAKFYASSMPVLEDGLSSGHTSDTENNNPSLQKPTGISMLMDMKRLPDTNVSKNPSKSVSPNINLYMKNDSPLKTTIGNDDINGRDSVRSLRRDREILGQSPSNTNNKVFKNIDPDLDSLYSISVFHRPDIVQLTPPPPAPAPHRKPNILCGENTELSTTPIYVELRPPVTAQSRTKPLTPTMMNPTTASNQLEKSKIQNIPTSQPPPVPERNNQSPLIESPIWIPRHVDSSTSLLESENYVKNLSGDEDDVDTDLETDRLLGHQRLDDHGYYEEKNKTSWERKPRSLLASSLSKFSPKIQQNSKPNSSILRQGLNSLLPTTPEIPPPLPPKNSTNKLLDIGGSISSPEHSEKSPLKSTEVQNSNVNNGMDSPGSSCDGVNNKMDNNAGVTGTTNGGSNNGGNVNVTGPTITGPSTGTGTGEKKVKKSGAVLIEGVLFRARYLGSTQLVCEGQPTKSTRMMQAEEAVSRIKAPDGDAQPSTEVDLFISTEKIMVLNTDLKEIMMDHALRTISYIADIGDLVVLMARRRFVPQDIDDGPKPNRTPKMICHVFESDEAQFIAQSIGQAFQVAYMEFLKANGIEDHSFVKEMDYQEVLNSQEIFGDELEIFAKKELQKEVVVPKSKGEILGVVIVESGWGSMLPTVVIANLMSTGAAARCGQLNIGDQLIAINGMSLVGLPLSTCQTYIKNTKNQTVVKFTVVPCPPVVEVKIKRPNTKYQLGFSVQNGVICSLLRGGIAERGGVRVGHRIIEINNQSVVAVPHEKIVNLLATSVGEILMKTMPTSMFRLLTGQENPIFI